MPAAAVIPAPIAYIKVVVVKKLVVEPGPRADRSASPRALVLPVDFYCEKIRVFKAGLCSNTLAWNNRIGRVVLFCWLWDRRND